MQHRPLRLLICVLAAAAVLLPPASARADTEPDNAANRVIFWTGCQDLARMTDAELDAWRSRGVGGFACIIRHLWNMGGLHDFTADPDADLSPSRYTLQRELRDSRVGARAAARGMKLYLGAYLVNYYNTATPLREWFDDEGWNKSVLPEMRDLAGAARQLGFAGLAFDQELYGQTGGATTATWNWNYPGNVRSEHAVRAKVTARGRQLMSSMLASYPGIELLAYDTQLPETWAEFVQKQVNGHDDVYRNVLHIDFWDGLSSVEGYRAIRLVDATFHKIPHIGNWDSAFQYHYNRLYSYLSRRLTNWDYASSRLYVSPFSWINTTACGCGFSQARSAEHVAKQLDAFRRWGMGGEFANYAWGGVGWFDYSPYEDALRAAARPGVVDGEAPGLTVSGVAKGPDAGTVTLSGTATDNLAVKAIRWRTADGARGMARGTWEVLSGSPTTGYRSQIRWTAPVVPVKRGSESVAVTVEDIKGISHTRTVGLDGFAGPASPPKAAPRAGAPKRRPATRRSKAQRPRSHPLARRLRKSLRRCLARAAARPRPMRRAAAKRTCAVRHRVALKRHRAGLKQRRPAARRA